MNPGLGVGAPAGEHPSRFVAIVGAPRCGTTSLSSYLRTHPCVQFSSIKEPHFFALNDLRDCPREQLQRQVEQDYLRQFFPGSRPGMTLAEGSVSYLYAPEQMEPILRIWPDARFVIAVRDPMELLPSIHRRLLLLGDENVEDFARAWSLSGSRAEGREIPRTCVEPLLLRYPEIGRLGHYVSRFFDAVGRERCSVVVFDDLRRDPHGTYRALLDFLDLPDDGRRDFPKVRRGTGYRLGWLQRLLKRPPGLAKKIRDRTFTWKSRAAPSPTANLVLGWRKRVLRWNRIELPPSRLSPSLREEIRASLSDDVELLGDLIGRDLSHWLGRRASGEPAAPGAETHRIGVSPYSRTLACE